LKIITDNKKSTDLHLLHAFIYQEKLENKFAALYSLMYAEEYKPNFVKEFSLFCFK